MPKTKRPSPLQMPLTGMLAKPAATPFDNHQDIAVRPHDDDTAASPFIKWVGGKRALASTITALEPPGTKNYWEPFIGGGAVFFNRCRIHKAHLSDINSELTTTYLVVKQFPDLLIEKLRQHALDHQDPDHYYRVRKMTHLTSPIDVAARFIYLNKTCYNGLYRVNRRGIFNVAKGSYKNPVICDPVNIATASRALENASIELRDFSRIEPASGDFVYCDPPHDGTFAGYTAKPFSTEQQRRLRDHCQLWHQAGVHIMVSNSDTKLIQELYSQPPFEIHTVSAPRSISAKATARNQVTELLITTYPTPTS